MVGVNGHVRYCSLVEGVILWEYVTVDVSVLKYTADKSRFSVIRFLSRY